MHRTMFDTPVLSQLLRAGSSLYLRLKGWRIEGSVPDDLKKCVMIAAPHTSNWDLPYMLMIAFVMRTPIYWMGKKSIFKPPFKHLMMWMGGVPVDRSKSNNMVDASVATIKNNDRLFLIVPPEGTRSKVNDWKTGFYHIANGAQVPILMGFLDYQHKTGGVLGTFEPSGDVQQDIASIRQQYSHIGGRKADQY